MKKIIAAVAIFFLNSFIINAQLISDIITQSEVERIEKTLSSNEMQGRKVFTEGIEKAANFIVSEFAKNNLQFFGNNNSYKQSFTMLKPKFINATATINNLPIASKDVVVVTSKTDLNVTEKNNYSIAEIKSGSNIFREASFYVQAKQNTIVFVDTIFKSQFSRLSFLKRQIFKSDYSTIFILSSQPVITYSVQSTHEITELNLSNIVAVLPGKSKKNEYVIFSGHYDHLGIGKPNANQDSIYNGANDDAAGITAVIALSKYFSSIKNNERTLIFVAFTAEESGGYGSQYFSKQLNPDEAVAMFNIEMIGTESKWGTNSAYITGFDKTDFGAILQKNLEGTNFQFHPDPYPSENLFFRSDNATLARLGVPAHTISTSKMDTEPNYHKPSDEFETLDMKNMTEIIKAIALSSTSIVNAKNTPTRVKGL